MTQLTLLCSPKALSSLASAVKEGHITKNDLGWSLEELEAEARSFCEEFPMEFDDPQESLRPMADPSLAEEPTGEAMDIEEEPTATPTSQEVAMGAGTGQRPLIEVVAETDV